MNHAPAPTDVDPKEFERAQETWHWFTNLFKTATMAIIVVVVLLAWITL
jgi:hypothetical protein